MKETKEARLSELKYFNEDTLYTIAVFESDTEQFYAVGYMPRPMVGRRYELTGEWTVHPRYGEQFAFSSYEEPEPATSDGILSFLASGIIKGVGPSTAAAIVKAFGDEALKIIAETPDRLTEVSGIGKVKAAAIAESYAEHREYANTVMALSALDLTPAACMKLYRAFGSAASDIVRQNPYQLIASVPGFGFRRADKIAEKIGYDPSSPFRIKSGFKYCLEALAAEGHTYYPRAEFTERCAAFLDVSREQVEDALVELAMEGDIFAENLAGEEIVQLWRYRRAEQKVAGRLYALCHASLSHVSGNAANLIRASELESGLKLSEQQKGAVLASLQSGVCVITGGPGTGKTTIINTILKILKAEGVPTALAAPTGRAAKRMTEATGEEARTIHRLLEYYYEEESDEMRFGKTAEDPLEVGCVIVDEMSMVDILLMEGLLSAVRDGTRLILVGDADQLPSVGAGNVLKDILESDTVHSVRLTEIFRQAAESLIVVNAHRINRGEYPSWNEKGKDFFFLERRREPDIQALIRDLVAVRLPAYYADCSPLTDIQVLTPTKKGLLGSVALNKVLQEVLNPPAPGKEERAFGERIYREGDKVMQNKNDYMLPWRDIRDFTTGMGVFNGDLGIVQTVDRDAGTVSVLFDGCRLATYDAANLEELEPAFAMTVHKSQGSEFPVVVMPAARFAPMLATRNLLYTAVTRARKGAVLAGMPEAVYAMVDNNDISARYSGLDERLKAMWGFSDDF
ncbi:MAG: ATP-dependent RecD-like DNA helicase [Clostridia bacterium]|nr:ATP-dependent RecD-like DNA helicase [Clostridia bacterium]